MLNGTPTDMLTAYVRAFETLSAEAVVAFYHRPFTFIRPDAAWVVQDEATALVLVNHLIEHARSQGYHRTDVSRLAVRTLAANLAELEGVFVRYDAAQEEIARFGFTYILRQTDGQWRIVVAVAHDALGRRETQA
jgi:hypothetical protein